MAGGLSTGILVIKSEQRGLVPAALVQRLEERTLHHAEDVLEIIKPYPPTEGPNYVRTHDLENAWEIKRVVESDALRYRIVNNVVGRTHHRPYAVYVVGKWQTQAAKDHQWKRIQDIMDRGALARIMQAEIRAALRGGL